MAEKGARTCILLSRSGAEGKDAQELLEEMTTRGVNIAAPACGISAEAAVSATIKELKQSMPPIKGYIQASMVLKVSYLPTCYSYHRDTDALKGRTV